MIRVSLLARAALAMIPLACLDAAAIGFGRGPGSAVLGARLDFQVPVRLDAGETLTPECISAEVRFGDALVPPGLVSIALVSSPAGDVIRVRTSSAIDEPLVSVSISAGCEVRLSRRFTLFADPIEFSSSPRLANADAAAPAVQAPPVASPASPPPGPSRDAGGVAASASPSSPASPAAAAADAARAAAPVASGPAVSGPVASGPVASAPAPAVKAADAAAAPTRPAVAPRKAEKKADEKAEEKSQAQAKAAPRPRSADTTNGGAGRAKADGAAQSRLTIDSPGLPKTAAALREQQQTALQAAQDAALAAEAAASAAQARAASLEKTLEALQRDAKANREAVARLTDALASAQGAASDSTLWMALAGSLVVVSGGLAFALRRERRAVSAAWAGEQAQAAEPPPGARAPAAEAAEPVAPHAPAPRAAVAQEPFAAVAGGAGPQTLPPAVAPAETPVAAPAEPEVFGPVSSAPMRNISIDELLDLEQQVEFFTVLGQDEPAVELLTEHVRKTGGTHPFPYLKLLEIYRRMGDRDAYERTRTRFNQRFNAVAAGFDAPADEASRPLEDYPRAIERIQRSWSRPVDAMATLENMLVRAEGREGFGVEALAEVLFLFTLARDVHLQQAGASADGGSDVDVLLPFADSKPLGFMDSTVPEDAAAAGGSSGPLSVNFEDDGAFTPAAAPMPSPSARFGITVGIAPEQVDRALAAQGAGPASFAQMPVPSHGEPDGLQPQDTGADVDLPLGASILGSLQPNASPAVDLQLGDSAMTPLNPGPADLTLKGRSELPLPSSAQSDEASVDLELGGSMMGSLFGDLPKPTTASPAASSPSESDAAPLPALEIPLEFDAPAAPAATAAPPAPLPTFEINLEGLELEPRPPKPAPGDEGAKSS